MLIVNLVISDPDVCPLCIFGGSDTYTDFAMRHFALGPADGECASGTQKYVHMGADFDQPTNACCCLTLAAPDTTTPAVCNSENPTENSVTCPANLKIGREETVAHYYGRIASSFDDAPSDGCCGEGTFKYIYEKEYTGEDADICNCVIINGGFINCPE